MASKRKGKDSGKPKEARYPALLTKIFFDGYQPGATEVEWDRSELESAAAVLGVEPPKNLGDVNYSARSRTGMPERIAETQPAGMEWIIEGRGKGKYVFRLVREVRIEPNTLLRAIKIPEATPEIIKQYALTDEQALLARIRYNRLLDIFLGITAYSMQNHLRTTVKGMGQIEIDEIYVAVDKHGRQFVLPVQAKGGKDKHTMVQTSQDIKYCAQKFPDLMCRAISAQFVGKDLVALFELALDDGEVRLVEERHYRLVAFSDITPEDLESYSRSA
jgi:hypothetical protein